nr:Shikimate kinase [Paraburkholderia busanensis]
MIADTGRVPPRVCLIGMMGTGKSTIGRLLAARHAVDFVDTDLALEAHAGRTIADLFARDGEAHFRLLETQMLAQCLGGSRVVISTGGGVVLSAVNRSLLAARATTVWLKADIDTLWQRVHRDSARPLLNTADPHATLRELMRRRDALYRECADLCVETDALTPDQVADEIEARLVGSPLHSIV